MWWGRMADTVDWLMQHHFQLLSSAPSSCTEQKLKMLFLDPLEARVLDVIWFLPMICTHKRLELRHEGGSGHEALIFLVSSSGCRVALEPTVMTSMCLRGDDCSHTFLAPGCAVKW